MRAFLINASYSFDFQLFPWNKDIFKQYIFFSFDDKNLSRNLLLIIFRS